MFGFLPISSEAISAMFVKPQGTALVQLSGVEGIGEIGTSSGAAQIKYFTTGVEGTGLVDILGDLFINASKRTVFLRPVTATLGSFTVTGTTFASLNSTQGVEAAGQVGVVMAQATFAPVVGVESISALSTADAAQHAQWEPIVPPGTRQWTKITPTRIRN